jgi:hypothetical protein
MPAIVVVMILVLEGQGTRAADGVFDMLFGDYVP